MSGEVYTAGQFSNVRVAKPFSGFITKYQGLQISKNPIAMPGNLDPRAGTPGYDPNLIAGIPVPMGSKVMLWLPRFGPISYSVGGAMTYQYRLCWRIRSLEEQTGDVNDLLSGHLGQQLPGIPQAAGPSGSGSPGLRYIVPAAFETVQLAATQAEPRVVNVDTALYTLSSPDSYFAPIAASYAADKMHHAAMLSQGFFPNGNGAPAPSTDNAGFSGGPQYGIVETTARGDELIILISRGGGVGETNWDFAGVDIGLAQMLGANEENIGAYVFTGTVTG